MQMHEVPGEPNAETEIALIEHAAGLGRYALKPHTGRKHQLRAHMNALGRPIAGDRIYPQLLPEDSTPDYANPLQLLARSIEFIDPITGQSRRFESLQRLRSPTPDWP